MNTTTISRAQTEARKFLSRSSLLLSVMERDGDKVIVSGTCYSGALRRASLELTRALAEMRRPN